MSETVTLLVIVGAVTLIDFFVFRLGFPLGGKSWRLVRFVLWHSAVAWALLFLFLLFVITLLRNLDYGLSRWVWENAIGYHLIFSFFYSVYLEWFPGHFAKTREVAGE